MDLIMKNNSDVLEYKIVQKINNNKKLKKVAIIFKVEREEGDGDNKNKKRLKSSLTFYKLSKVSDKWWESSNSLFRTHDLLNVVLRHGEVFTKINQYLLKKYIFLQCLSSAFNLKSLKSTIKNSYTNCEYRNVKELGCNPDVSFTRKEGIRLIDSKAYVKCYASIINSLNYLLKRLDISKKDKCSDKDCKLINEYLIKMIKKLQAFDVYNEIRDMSLDMIKDYSKENELKKNLKEKQKNFTKSLTLAKYPEITEDVANSYDDYLSAKKNVLEYYLKKNSYYAKYYKKSEELDGYITANDFGNTMYFLYNKKILGVKDLFVCIFNMIRVVKELSKSNEDLVKQVETLTEENKKLKTEVSELRKEVAELREDNKKLREDNKKLREDNKKLREDNKKLIKRIAILEKKLGIR